MARSTRPASPNSFYVYDLSALIPPPLNSPSLFSRRCRFLLEPQLLSVRPNCILFTVFLSLPGDFFFLGFPPLLPNFALSPAVHRKSDFFFSAPLAEKPTPNHTSELPVSSCLIFFLHRFLSFVGLSTYRFLSRPFLPHSVQLPPELLSTWVKRFPRSPTFPVRFSLPFPFVFLPTITFFSYAIWPPSFSRLLCFCLFKENVELNFDSGSPPPPPRPLDPPLTPLFLSPPSCHLGLSLGTYPFH